MGITQPCILERQGSLATEPLAQVPTRQAENITRKWGELPGL